MPGENEMRDCETRTEHYVSVDGDPGNDGTIGSPWNLSHAASGANGCVKPGDTVWVRGGTYRPREKEEFKITVSGTAEQKITFKAYSSETVILDGSFPEFTTPGNTAWDALGTPAPGQNLYLSTQKYPLHESTIYGGFIQIAGEWYSLAPHINKEYLSSDIHVWAAPPTPRYLGPGLTQRPDGHLLIRLDNSTTEAQLGHPVPQISDPDPRHHSLSIGSSAFFGLTVTGSHLVIEDFSEINSFGGCFRMKADEPGQTDVTIRNCGGRPLYFGIRCAYIDGLTLDSCKFYAHMPSDNWWVAYSDIKGAKKENPPADHVRKVGLDLGLAAHMEVVDCLLDEFFDGILAKSDRDTGAAAHDIEVHRTIFNHIWDDAWQMTGGLYQINFHHNFCYGAGPSVGDPQANTDPGTVYIHHNVIDTTTGLVFWGRHGANGEGLFEPIPLSSHAGSLANQDPEVEKYTWPRKIYYNTIFTGDRAAPYHHYVGWSLLGAKILNINHQGTHEVFNNIFLVKNGRAGGKDFDATSGHEVYDGNVYWHDIVDASSDRKSPWQLLWISSQTEPFKDTITAEQLHLRAYDDSHLYYPPGWEESGLSEDPKLDSMYKPHNASCQIGAVDLTMKGWPGTASYEAWRGALNPFPEEETDMQELVLFDHPDFHGVHMHLYDSEPSLHVGDGSIFTDKIPSFVVTSGNWQIFAGPNFSGHASRVFGPGRYNWEDSVEIPLVPIFSIKRVT